MKVEHSFQTMVVRQLRMSNFIVISCDIMDATRFLKNKTNRIWFINQHKMRGYTNGQPDLVVGKNGQFYALEIKTKTGRMSPEQKAFKKRCEEEGLTYLVIKDFEDVKNLINANFRGVSIGGTD